MGPRYCETPDVFLGGIAEPVNAWTSLFPVAAVIAAVWYVHRRANRAYDLYILAALLFLTGMGSML